MLLFICETAQISRAHEFEADALARAIAATFARRNTPIPADPPFALTQAFADERAKQQQWISFVESIDAESVALDKIVEDLAAFLVPHVIAARHLSEIIK